MSEEEGFAIARAWAALADVLRVDDKHRIFGPYSRRTLEDAEKGLRPLVFGRAKKGRDTEEVSPPNTVMYDDNLWK